LPALHLLQILIWNLDMYPALYLQSSLVNCSQKHFWLGKVTGLAILSIKLTATWNIINTSSAEFLIFRNISDGKTPRKLLSSICLIELSLRIDEMWNFSKMRGAICGSTPDHRFAVKLYFFIKLKRFHDWSEIKFEVYKAKRSCG